MTRAITATALLLAASFCFAKDKPAYEVGTFLSTTQQSDGVFSSASCGRYSCSGSAYSAAHNVHTLSTPEGAYMLEAPTSVVGTIILGSLTGGNAPTIHKAWFMDNLHEGDKVLFSASCNRRNNCTFRLPNPDRPDKEIVTVGYFAPATAKTNAAVLCGTGKLSLAVEAQVCSVQPATAASTAPVRVVTQPAATQAAVRVIAPLPPYSATAGQRICVGYAVDSNGNETCTHWGETQ